MKKPIILIVFMILLLGTSNANGLDLNHTGHEQTTTTAKYEVLGSNESATVYWYTEDYSEFYPFTVQNGSEIQVELLDPTAVNTKMNVTIGNITQLGVTDNLAEEILTLGVYGYSDALGFVSSADWSSIETSLSSSTDTLDFNTEANYTFGVRTFEAVNITFSLGQQQTTLSYNKNNGILYYAKTTFGNYYLEFGITGYVPVEDVNVISPSSSEEGPISLGIVVFGLALISSRRRK